MSAHAQMIRLQEIVGNVAKNDCAFTKEELDQILYDSKALFTKECFNVIKALVEQIRSLSPTSFPGDFR